jgi:CRP-like cAMP-binding protein
MTTIAELKKDADDRLYADAFEDALALYTQILEAQPLNLDARLRIGDTLLALGEVQRAAVVYMRLAQYAANAGYPLRALVALKILGVLEPGLSPLVAQIGELYGRDSARIGVSARRSLPLETEELPRTSTLPDARGEGLAAQAEQLATNYQHKDALLPDKLMPIPLLSKLDTQGLARVFQAFKLVRARPDAKIVEQGQPGDSLFVLARGTARVMRAVSDGGAAQVVAVLHEGTVFGELSLLTGAQRSATVVASGDCDLLELSSGSLGDDEARAQLWSVISTFAHQRLLSFVMSHSLFFTAIDPTQRRDLMKHFVEVEAPKGTYVLKQGEPSPGVYVVLRGQLAVIRTEGDQSVELAKLNAPEMVGEMSLLSGGGATADVIAAEPTTLLFLAKSFVERLLEVLPDLRERLDDLAGRRSREIAVSFVPPQPGTELEIEIEVMV